MLACVAALGGGAGCAKKIKPYTAEEAIAALTTRASKVQTVRGRAWVKAKAPEQKISFPAIIAIDRTNPKAPKLRIEAIDPFGTTHALMILEANQKFTWLDYDRNESHVMRSTWYGLPLSKLPDLILGVATPPESAKVVSSSEDGFESKVGDNTFKYDMTWIDPGPRLALEGLNGEVKKPNGAIERYVVEYSKYLDYDEFYMPEEIKLLGFTSGKSEPDLEVQISWRERKWNETVPDRVFVPPQIKR